MTNNRPLTLLTIFLGLLTATCSTACAPGIDVGQVDAGLEIAPGSLNLGTALVNTTITQTAVVTNSSAAEIDGISATIGGTNAPWFAVAGLPSNLAAGGQATVSISFAPLAASAEATATVTFSATGLTPATLDLTGTAVATALVFEPTTIEFGYTPLLSTVIACTTVTNQANLNITITGISSFEDLGGAYALSATDDASPPNPAALPVVIVPGGKAEVCFTFTPPITQDYQGQATLITTDPSGVDPVIQLDGWGGGPQIDCTPLSLNFGSGAADGGTAMLPVLCTNTGTSIPGIGLLLGPLTTSSSAFSAQFETPLDGGDLVPGQSATIEVTYQPSGDGGDTGTLEIDSNGGEGQPVSISLSGSGD